MPPKEHRVIDNDVVYEIREDTSSGIQFVVCLMKMNEVIQHVLMKIVFNNLVCC
jgi:hypothetical protein